MKKYIPWFYLGVALGGFGEIYFYQWEFYAIAVPMIVLQALVQD